MYTSDKRRRQILLFEIPKLRHERSPEGYNSQGTWCLVKMPFSELAEQRRLFNELSLVQLSLDEQSQKSDHI